MTIKVRTDKEIKKEISRLKNILRQRINYRRKVKHRICVMCNTKHNAYNIRCVKCQMSKSIYNKKRHERLKNDRESKDSLQ